MAFELPDLPYAHDALASKGMSQETLEYHHDIHHNTYVTTLNKLIDGTEWADKSLEEIVKGTYDSGAVAHEKDAKQGLLVQQKPPARAPKKSTQQDGFECSRIDGLARPLLVAKGSKGYAACAYVDIAAADKFGEACVIFSGVATHEAFLDAPRSCNALPK